MMRVCSVANCPTIYPADQGTRCINTSPTPKAPTNHRGFPYAPQPAPSPNSGPVTTSHAARRC